MKNFTEITKENLIEVFKDIEKHSQALEDEYHNFINENIVDIDAFIKENPLRALVLSYFGMDVFIEVFEKWRKEVAK